jgi:hypothetical protein
MRVRCIANVVGKLSDSAVRNRLVESIHLEGPDRDLVIGEIYAVVAITRWKDGGIHVYLHTIEVSEHPYPYPLEMFEVVDSSVPVGWCVGFKPGPDGLFIDCIGFAEWVDDSGFFERLVDGEQDAVSAYARQRSAASTCRKIG